MWEQVAIQYSASRTRGSPERDFKSLRRKFKNLYSNPKPTGSGEVPLRIKPVIWAKGIQQKIEAEGEYARQQASHTQDTQVSRQSAGTVATRQGLIDVSLVAEIDLSNDEASEAGDAVDEAATD
ncbi:hypothetical protein GN958_ATG13633 [Phytophthora infestans]|uniref:DUF6818 domain-containing protein n=1 Tax=Phytophthora infestans TaxID=4787 RepID=A0A8S9U7U9_PHYIN|nr:hypothetical protein GN958_ATG13633 [Phytophthora infestans]